MISDKDLGLKIAKDPEEELWIGIEDRAKKAILSSKAEIEIQTKILELCKEKIKK